MAAEQAYLNFEVKGHDRLRRRRYSKSDLSNFDIINAGSGNSRNRRAVLEFKVQIRSGQPRDESKGVAGGHFLNLKPSGGELTALPASCLKSFRGVLT